jgi:hypothetical protein
MPYSDSLDNEKKPSRRQLLDQGWRAFVFESGEDKPSKAGNQMFIMQTKDVATGYVEPVFLVRTEGKRWLLKAALESVGIKRSEDGKYNYELSDLLGKELLGEVIHEPDEYINRNGDTVKTTRHKIVDFKRAGLNPGGVTKAEDVKWDE